MTVDPSPSACGTEEPVETDEETIDPSLEDRTEPETKPDLHQPWDKELETLIKLFPHKPKITILSNSSEE